MPRSFAGARRMHPSKAIRGRSSLLLSGRRIVLAVSGSIAAIEAPRVARELLRHGAEVQAVMSAEATRIVTPEAMAFATGRPPVVQLTGDVEHVTWLGPGPDRADLLLIAPATANTLSKIAHGIDDTPVTTFASIALGGRVPVLVAPAMHGLMGENPAVRENLERLATWGVEVVTPTASEGEEKLASPERIAAEVLHRLARGPWKGRRVVVIGGAARESIDSVRSITNESTGAMAMSLAEEAYFRGAEVELWAGALQVPVPDFLVQTRWRAVRDLLELMRRRERVLRTSAAIFVPAALSDFTMDARPGKISSREASSLELSLIRAPKILPELRRLAPAPIQLLAFKLEATEDPRELEREGRVLLDEAGLDWVVANSARTLGHREIDAIVIGPEGARHTLAGPKRDVAGKLLDDVGRALAVVPVATPAARPGRRREARRRRRAGHRTPRR